MYSNKNIPAPFAQPHRSSNPEKGMTGKKSAIKKEAEKDNAASVPAKEKTAKKNAASSNASPLLAVLLLDLFCKKEG